MAKKGYFWLAITIYYDKLTLWQHLFSLSLETLFLKKNVMRSLKDSDHLPHLLHVSFFLLSSCPTLLEKPLRRCLKLVRSWPGREEIFHLSGTLSSSAAIKSVSMRHGPVWLEGTGGSSGRVAEHTHGWKRATLPSPIRHRRSVW